MKNNIYLHLSRSMFALVIPFCFSMSMQAQQGLLVKSSTGAITPVSYKDVSKLTFENEIMTVVSPAGVSGQTFALATVESFMFGVVKIPVVDPNTGNGKSKTLILTKGGVKLFEQHISNVDSVVFKTNLNTVTDIEGNEYRTITYDFGNGVKTTWMIDNLKTTKLNDGTPIFNVVNDNAKYENGTSSGDFRMTPAYCWHMNQPYNKDIYGALYNHLAIETGKLAPAGWHVATNEEWTALENMLAKTDENNYDLVAPFDGTALKVAKSMASELTWVSTSAWQEIGNSPHRNNKSGFSLVACGFRDGSAWGQVCNNGYYWTSTVTLAGSATVIGAANSRNITASQRGFSEASVTPLPTGCTSQGKTNGIQLLFGVRCVKDAAP